MDEKEHVVLTSRGRPARAVLSVVAAIAVLTGCSDDGGSTPTSSVPPTGSASSGATASPTASPTASEASVADVYRAARTASLSAESGRAVGTVTRDGTELGIDVEGLANGANQTVFISSPGAGTAEVLTVGDLYWVGGDEAHWVEITGDPKAAKALVGKYAPVTESDATELGSFTLRTILTDVFSLPEFTVLESDTGAATPTELDGQPAYLLGQPGGARLWVAADGSGTLLRVVGPKSDPSDLTFSDWGRATTFVEPPPAQVVEN